MANSLSETTRTIFFGESKDPNTLHKISLSDLLVLCHKESELMERGFPLFDHWRHSVKPLRRSVWELSEPRCRCKKKINLSQANWYSCKKCQFHPLKAKHGKFQCCKGAVGSTGCTVSKFHVSSEIPALSYYVKSRIPYLARHEDIFAFRNVYALDCEFVYTVHGLEVARVSLVSLMKGVVYDSFVQPQGLILDFNTAFTGITSQMFNGSLRHTFVEMRDNLLKFINEYTILIGHSLHCDLRALQICHERIIDTGILFPHHHGPDFTHSLEYLAKEHLGEEIHRFSHNSVEDASICLKLVIYYHFCQVLAKKYILNSKSEISGLH